MSLSHYYGRTRGALAHWSGARLLACTIGAVERHAGSVKFTPTGAGDKRLARRLYELKERYTRNQLGDAAYRDAIDTAIEEFEE